MCNNSYLIQNPLFLWSYKVQFTIFRLRRGKTELLYFLTEKDDHCKDWFYFNFNLIFKFDLIFNLILITCVRTGSSGG